MCRSSITRRALPASSPGASVCGVLVHAIADHEVHRGGAALLHQSAQIAVGQDSGEAALPSTTVVMPSPFLLIS